MGGRLCVWIYVVEGKFLSTTHPPPYINLTSYSYRRISGHIQVVFGRMSLHDLYVTYMRPFAPMSFFHTWTHKNGFHSLYIQLTNPFFVGMNTNWYSYLRKMDLWVVCINYEIRFCEFMCEKKTWAQKGAYRSHIGRVRTFVQIRPEYDLKYADTNRR